jgi:hypothetical protein
MVLLRCSDWSPTAMIEVYFGLLNTQFLVKKLISGSAEYTKNDMQILEINMQYAANKFVSSV